MPVIDSPYNIPSPDSMYAGSYRELSFEARNPWSEQDVDLSNAVNVVFTMALFGEFSNDNDNAVLVRITKNDVVGNLRKIVIDSDNPSLFTVRLFPEDTIFFEDAWYDFQITLYDADGIRNSTIGRGKIRVFKNIQ